MDVITAKSEKALEISGRSALWISTDKIREIDSQIIDMLVLIESNLDYPEYEIEQLTNEKDYYRNRKCPDPGSEDPRIRGATAI